MKHEMERKRFGYLVQSIRDGDAILRGEMKGTTERRNRMEMSRMNSLREVWEPN